MNCTSREGGPCQTDPCGNNGNCYEGVDKYFCGCKPGWKGPICESESKAQSLTLLGLGKAYLKIEMWALKSIQIWFNGES